jgi:hypothetical protein
MPLITLQVSTYVNGVKHGHSVETSATGDREERTYVQVVIPD